MSFISNTFEEKCSLFDDTLIFGDITSDLIEEDKLRSLVYETIVLKIPSQSFINNIKLSNDLFS